MNSRIIVLFGRKQSETAARQRLAEWWDGKSTPGAMSFAPGVTPPLRLCHDDGTRHPPAVLADVPDTAAKLASLKSHAARDLDVFARNPRRLLDLYFEFIAARVDMDDAFLERRQKLLGDLFRAGDWVFTALRPLPNAVVFDAKVDIAKAAVIHHDLAFWTGREVLTIRIRGGETLAPREGAAIDRLEACGVRVVTIPARELGDRTAIFSEPRFPPEFLHFWRNASYPCSPFRPQGLPRNLSLD